MVDGQFDAVQALDDEIESLEDLLFDDRPRDEDVQRRSFALRKSLVQLRRVVLPIREVVNTLMRREVGVVPTELTAYYQDLYDHVLRASEWTESLRDLVSTIMETSLTIQGNRLNIITKKVTSWAAIIAVPTAITGFYGQNVPYPGFAATSGILTSTSLILVMSVASTSCSSAATGSEASRSAVHRPPRRREVRSTDRRGVVNCGPRTAEAWKGTPPYDILRARPVSMNDHRGRRLATAVGLASGRGASSSNAHPWSRPYGCSCRCPRHGIVSIRGFRHASGVDTQEATFETRS